MSPDGTAGANENFLVLEAVSQHFDMGKHLLTRESKGVVKAVDNVSLTIREGEIFGIVGESELGGRTRSCPGCHRTPARTSPSQEGRRA